MSGNDRHESTSRTISFSAFELFPSVPYTRLNNISAASAAADIMRDRRYDIGVSVFLRSSCTVYGAPPDRHIPP